MSAKPTVVPTYATDANFTNGPAAIIGTPTKVAPSAGVRAEGHIPDTAPGAQHENYDRNAIGLWLTYLSDGDFDGPLLLNNADGRGAALTITQNDDLAAGLIVAHVAAAAVAAGLFEGGLEVYPGSVVAPRGFRQRAQGPIALRDTEEYRYCDSVGALTTKTRTIMVPLTDARVGGNWAPVGPALGGGGGYEWSVTAPAVESLAWEVRLPGSAIVTQVRAGVKQQTNDASDVRLEALSVSYDKNASGGLAPTVASLGSDAAASYGADVVLSVTGLSLTIGAANGLVIRIDSSGAGGGNVDHVYWLEVTYSDPGPKGW